MPCYDIDRVLFPGAQCSPEDQRADTTFFNDFMIAEMYGMPAIRDTFQRCFDSWKSVIKFLTELAVVTNHLGWMHYGKDNEKSKYYFDCFNKISAYVYQADDDGENIGPFTDEEVVFFHNVLD